MLAACLSLHNRRHLGATKSSTRQIKDTMGSWSHETLKLLAEHEKSNTLSETAAREKEMI